MQNDGFTCKRSHSVFLFGGQGWYPRKLFEISIASHKLDSIAYGSIRTACPESITSITPHEGGYEVLRAGWTKFHRLILVSLPPIPSTWYGKCNTKTNSQMKSWVCIAWQTRVCICCTYICKHIHIYMRVQTYEYMKNTAWLFQNCLVCFKPFENITGLNLSAQ